MLIWEGVLASLLTSWLLLFGCSLFQWWKFPQRSGIWGFGGMEKRRSHGENKGRKEKTRTLTIAQVMYPTTLFVSPKQGGILQCSGFLDLQSLLRLSRTAKAHAFDELSLIQLIENEVTVRHQVTTVEGAITFLKNLRNKRLLRQWLDRASSTATIPTQNMIFQAVRYEVMLAKMMRAVPKVQHLQDLSEGSEADVKVLHWAAFSGNPDSIGFLLGLWPEAQRAEAVCMLAKSQMTVLHFATDVSPPSNNTNEKNMYASMPRPQVPNNNSSLLNPLVGVLL